MYVKHPCTQNAFRELRFKYEELKQARWPEIEQLLDGRLIDQCIRDARACADHWRLECDHQAALAREAGTADLQQEREANKERIQQLATSLAEAENAKAAALIRAAHAEKELAEYRARVMATTGVCCKGWGVFFVYGVCFLCVQLYQKYNKRCLDMNDMVVTSTHPHPGANRRSRVGTPQCPSTSNPPHAPAAHARGARGASWDCHACQGRHGANKHAWWNCGAAATQRWYTHRHAATYVSSGVCAHKDVVSTMRMPTLLAHTPPLANISPNTCIQPHHHIVCTQAQQHVCPPPPVPPSAWCMVAPPSAPTLPTQPVADVHHDYSVPRMLGYPLAALGWASDSCILTAARSTTCRSQPRGPRRWPHQPPHQPKTHRFP